MIQDFCANIRKAGAIAQLGERLHGMQEVVGSNPIGSIVILLSPKPQTNRLVLLVSRLSQLEYLAQKRSESFPQDFST
jgi:hypothetical protein